MQSLTFGQIRERLNNFDLPLVDLVVGIAEGGLVPASLVAFKLGVELSTIKINYRNEANTPIRTEPALLSDSHSLINKKILLVDDVSVSGKTLEKAKELFVSNEIITLTFKGKADYVLFPEISECVNWPWKYKL
jgi:hypoxanthine phosphoribosyltransferase